MGIFISSDYRKIIQYMVAERKKIDSRFGYQKLSEAANIQKPYMSKVMNGDANLSQDQMYAIATCLGLHESEIEFLLLCLEYDKTGLASRKQKLKNKIDAIIKEHKDTSKHIQAQIFDVEDPMSLLATFYLDPLHMIIHAALRIEIYAKNPLLLATHLQLTQQRLSQIIVTLKRMNLLSEENNRLVTSMPKTHLPKSSPLYASWRNQLKLIALQRINNLGDRDDNYSFNVVFTGTDELRQKIHTKFLEFLKYCESEVSQCQESHKTLQMSFDLFPWT